MNMYQSTIKPLTTIIAVACLAAVSYGQNIIYQYTFDDDMEGWTAVAVSSDEALWVWAANGDAGTGAYNDGSRPIASRSGGGALLFDSDGLDNGGVREAFGTGPAPSPQKGEIISPSMDFTGQDTVILAFNQYYRYFAKSAEDFSTPASSVEVSNDGGASWISFLVNEDISPNASTTQRDIEAIDITELAANQADVQIKFIWDGDYYFWLVDDVTFYDATGTNLVILEYTNMDNYESPDFVISNDTFDMEFMITNEGDADITDSIRCIARIIDEEAVLVFADTGYIEGLSQGDTVIWDFDNGWTPDMVSLDTFRIAYSVSVQGDTVGEIVAPDDNLEINIFEARDFDYSKVPSTNRAQGVRLTGQDGGDAQYDVANIFAMPAGVAEPLLIDRMTFTICRNQDGFANKSVIAFIAELPDTAEIVKGVLLAGETDLIGLDASYSVDNMLADEALIGIGQYEFTADDDQLGSCPTFTLDQLTDLEENDVILMKPGRIYLIGIRFGPTSQDLFMGVNEDYKLWQLSTIWATPQDGTPNWSLVTDYEENAAAIGVLLKLGTDVDEKPLPEYAVKVFPNPTTEQIKVDLTFEQPTDVSVMVADAQGKVLSIKNLDNIQSTRYQHDVSHYASGSYIVRIVTAEGTATKHIMVTH